MTSSGCATGYAGDCTDDCTRAFAAAADFVIKPTIGKKADQERAQQVRSALPRRTITRLQIPPSCSHVSLAVVVARALSLPSARAARCLRRRPGARGTITARRLHHAPRPLLIWQELTKKIQQRIERTMAARASTDGGGLQVLAAEAMEGGSDKRSLKPSLGVGRSGSSGGSALAKKKR